MRVCLVTSSYPRFRGDVAGNFVRDLARHLVALGFDIVRFVFTAMNRRRAWLASVSVCVRR